MAVTGSAYAETMICKGAGRTYTLTFNPAQKTLRSSAPGGASAFTVTTVDDLSVRGTTKDDGPSFVASFDGQKRFQLYHHGKLMQTALCR